MTGLLHWWMREEQLMPSAWTCARHLVLLHTTSLTLKWKDMDLMDVPLGGEGMSWIVALKDL